MDTAMTHDLPSATWRNRKTGGVIQSESEGLWTRSTKFWEQNNPLQEEEENSRFLVILIYSGPQLLGWYPPSFLSLLIQRLISPRKTSQTHLQIMFHQLSGHALVPPGWRIKLTITLGYLKSALLLPLSCAATLFWLIIDQCIWWVICNLGYTSKLPGRFCKMAGPYLQIFLDSLGCDLSIRMF